MKKRVRDKRGFTLIELLVVIALMLSILGIAVVSFVGISNKKKESSKELIKEQIETAALEYFNANEFLFSNLKDDVFGVISVGKLVNDDYLNVVTNPVTGKRIGNCTVVVVKRKNNVFTSDVDDESFENATDNQTGTQLTNVCDSILVSSDDIQGGKITYYDENYKKLTGKRFEDLSDNKKLWFNSKHLGKDRNLIACSKDEVEVTNTKGEEIKVEKNSHGYCATIKNGTNEDITYRSKDRSWTLTIAERVDTTPPLVSNLKVESENSYIGSKSLYDSKEYMSKFYSFKLIPEMPGKKSILTYNDIQAANIRKDGMGIRNTNDMYFDFTKNEGYKVPNSRDSEDIIVDGKLMMLCDAYSMNFEIEEVRTIADKMLPDLKDNGIYLISYNLEKKDFPKDITDYYWSGGINYDLNHKDNYQDLYFSDGVSRRLYKNGEIIKNEHIVDNEIRKVYKDYLYYTKQKKLCKINVDVNGRTFQKEHFVCSRIIEAYPKTLNVNAAGIMRTIIGNMSLGEFLYDKFIEYFYFYANYGKEINGQLTKMSFTYKDDTSKTYSYGLDKKYVKKVKRDDKFGDLIESNYLTKTLQQIKYIEGIGYNRNLYNFSYTTDKNTALKDNSLNEEYNKEVLNSVEIYDLKQSKDNYKKEKINKKEEAVEINHLYSFEDNSESKLDGSISNYKLTIKDNAGNETTSKANYEKYKLCTYTKQKVWDSPVDEQSCENVCNSHGTLVKKRGLGMVARVDEATEEFCSKPEFFGEDEIKTPNSPECPWTDCTVTTAKKTTKNQTTKSSKTTSTTKACDWSKVKISFSVSNANKDHCYAVDESVTKEKDATSFTVDFDYPSDFKKIATHAAFCKDAKTCKNITTSNKNQTSVVCTNSTNCYEEYKYVGASIELECGNTTKTIFDYDSIK